MVEILAPKGLFGGSARAMSGDERALLRRRKIGFVFQAFHVLPHLDVAQNVGLPLMLLHEPDDARVAAAPLNAG